MSGNAFFKDVILSRIACAEKGEREVSERWIGTNIQTPSVTFHRLGGAFLAYVNAGETSKAWGKSRAGFCSIGNFTLIMAHQWINRSILCSRMRICERWGALGPGSPTSRKAIAMSDGLCLFPLSSPGNLQAS